MSTTEKLEARKIHRSLDLMVVKPMIWKPAILKALGDGFNRRRLDKWIADGLFPKPDGVKFGHPWWYVSTFEAWRNTP